MNVKRILGLLVLLLMVAGLLAVFIRGDATSTESGKLQIVAAENFYGNIAQQLGGEHVQVTSIISDPTTDPHLYESSASNASAVGTADLVLLNGLGYDDFMQKLLNGSKSSQRQVITASKVLGVTAADANPHLWYDLPRIHKVAETISAYYQDKDPQHREDYERNLSTFTDSLQPLLAQIAAIKSQYAGSPVAFTEPVAGYLLQAAGLIVRTPEGFSKSIEDGNDPGAADATAMDALITDKAVKVLLYNPQATSPVTERVKGLAQQSGVPVVGVSETMPPNQPGQQQYQGWQRSQLNRLYTALETGR